MPLPPPTTLRSALARLGPGMIIAGSIVGSGELIATTKVGAEAGFTLLWLVVLGCVIKVFAQVELGRHAITWGETPLKALDGVPGPRYRVGWLVWYWAGMTVLIISQQGGIVGGVGQALSIAAPITEAGTTYDGLQAEAGRARVEAALAERTGAPDAPALRAAADSLAAHAAALPEPADPYIWAVLVAVLTSILLFVGRYRLIQAVSTILVASFTLMTVVSLIALQGTDWAISASEFGSGLSVSLPPDRPGLNPVATALAAFGIIGLGAAELIMYPYWCLEKGYARWTGPRDEGDPWAERARGWLRVLRLDAWLSMVVYTFATVAFYLLGAGVLWRIGLNPEGGTMVRTLSEMYVPVFGAWAQPLFLLGAVAVLYSTFFVAAAGNARMVADGLGLFGLHPGTEESRARWTRYISALWPLVAVVVLLFVRAPVAMVLASGVAQAVMLPMLGFAVLYFRYRRTDRRLAPGRVWDLFLWISCAGFAVVGTWALLGLWWG